MHDEPLGLLSAAAMAVLTDEELPDIWGAISFLAGCAQLAAIPHAEWWQLHYHAAAAFPWRVIDVVAPEGPDGTSHTVMTLHPGDWRFRDDDSPTGTTTARHRALNNLRIELEGRGYTLRGLWELRERGYTTDLMAASRYPQPARPRPAAHHIDSGGTPQ